jgi:hypothetical protein
MHYHWSLVRAFWNYILSNSSDNQGRGWKETSTIMHFVTSAISHRHQLYYRLDLLGTLSSINWIILFNSSIIMHLTQSQNLER